MKQFVDQMLAHALHHIFITMFGIGLLTLIVSWFLPSHQKVMEQQKQVA
ncbi:hypothetical protein GCM10025858_13980 [Alicyclobacillus sacchari]|nr:hypothetical protein GCM10025858_13980 [Alicyclobacillus sacchari]